MTRFAVIIWAYEKTNYQGIVFSISSMRQTAVMPIGFLIGGWLADYLFEPLMQSSSLLKLMVSKIIGSDEGAGMGQCSY